MVGYDKGILSEGYGIIPKAIFKDERLESGAKLVYSCLSSYGGGQIEGREVWPSVKTLCQECGISNKTVIKHLKKLEEVGYIKILKQTREDGGYSNNVYVLSGLLPEENYTYPSGVSTQGLVESSSYPSGVSTQGLVESVHTNNNNKTITYNNNNKTYNVEQARPCASDSCQKEVNEIIGYWNENYGKKFKPTSQTTKSNISARLREGFEVEDFKKVIDYKQKEWTGTEFAKYLAPQTLFSPSKFEKYLNQATDSSCQYNGMSSYMYTDESDRL